MNSRLALLAAAALSLASCGREPGLRGQITQLRAEIQDLEREVSIEAPLWPDQGENAFNRYIEDYTPRIPDFIYNHVNAKLAAMTEADFDAAVQPATDLKELIAHPIPARGKLWRVSGRIGHLAPERHSLVGTTKSREVFAGTLFAGDQPVHFHVVLKPDVVYLGSDEVDFIGVFVKVLGYPKPGEPTVSAPFFMAKTVRKYY
ncbi:MAG TPA: hypothetical protein VFC90_05680 [Planctomycetota bacterium]|nr:hypothetical protein [Planctomycetota bacterium]